jgi:hypothetical protein
LRRAGGHDAHVDAARLVVTYAFDFALLQRAQASS